MDAGMLRGLPPEIPADCRLLVLGSMPGAASLSEQRYYAHPRNRFWPLMAALCDFPDTLAYPQRLAALRDAGVGLWDVIGRCRRSGSLDAAILADSEVANPLLPVLQSHVRLRLVVFNGGKAAQAFRRHVRPDLPDAVAARVAFQALPSTSPANAAFAFERLLAEWGVVKRCLRQP